MINFFPNTFSVITLLEKYPNFGMEQPEVAGRHLRRIRSLANQMSLVSLSQKKSPNQVRGMCWCIVVMEAPIIC